MSIAINNNILYSVAVKSSAVLTKMPPGADFKMLPFATQENHKQKKNYTNNHIGLTSLFVHKYISFQSGVCKYYCIFYIQW